MNNKITFPELVEQVAQNANTSKRMSELFLKELFATISQSLIDGESVKVKGIGTFKLTEVSARKSVDVNTGEEIRFQVIRNFRLLLIKIWQTLLTSHLCILKLKSSTTT